MNAGFSVIYAVGLAAYVVYSIYKAATKQQSKTPAKPWPKDPAPFPPILSAPGETRKNLGDMLEELLGEQKKTERPSEKTPASHESHVPEKRKTERTRAELAVDYNEKKARKRKLLEQIPAEEPHLSHAFGKIHDIDELPADHSEEPAEIMGIDARKAIILSDVLRRPDY